MIWEIELRPRGGVDYERYRVAQEYDLLTHSTNGAALVTASARGYLIEGYIPDDKRRTEFLQVLADEITDFLTVRELGELTNTRTSPRTVTVLLKPGVMDPVAQTVQAVSRDLGLAIGVVRTFRRYQFTSDDPDPRSAFLKVLANDAIEQTVFGPLRFDHFVSGKPYLFQLNVLPIRDLNDNALIQLSRTGQLALNLAEMRAVQAHFRELGRDPTDVELETIAQTW